MNAFQRKFVGEVRRCDEMERKLSMSAQTNFEIPVVYPIEESHFTLASIRMDTME